MALPETLHQHGLYRRHSPQKTAGKFRASFDYFHFSRFRGAAKNDCSIFTPLPIVSRADVSFFTASRRRKKRLQHLHATSPRFTS